jgi:hypothetical protein
VATIPEPLLSGTRREFPIEQLLEAPGADQLRPGERALQAFILPPWQRPLVWDHDRKRRFIEGIFLGLGTGYYVAHAKDWDNDGLKPMAGWLLDGQQRISAVLDFAQGRLDIFNGIHIGDIDTATLRRRFLRVVFPCIELAYQEDENRLREVYDRLNFGGVPHTDADRQLLGAKPHTHSRQRG